MTQLALDADSVPGHRVEALAGVLAGFRWPGRRSFEKLRKDQQTVCLDVARDALERLARVEIE